MPKHVLSRVKRKNDKEKTKAEEEKKLEKEKETEKKDREKEEKDRERAALKERDDRALTEMTSWANSTINMPSDT